jgi:hypothetical protein
LGCADGGNPEVDLAGDPGESQRVGALVAQALECEVHTLDLAQPPLGHCAFPPLLQIRLQFVEKKLVAVTVDVDGDAGDRTGTVKATSGHPFWVDSEGRWSEAGELKPGDRVRTDDGTSLPVVESRAWPETRAVYNLTVDGIHPYYVLAGNESILVHNSPPPFCSIHGGDSGSPEGVGIVHGPAPKKAYDMLESVNARPSGIGKVPGYHGNGSFGNNKNHLPQSKYREWDVNAKDNLPRCEFSGCGKEIRGPERLLTPKDGPGASYYTDDHYGTFSMSASRNRIHE